MTTTGCERHRGEPTAGQCPACARDFCDRCLVRVRGSRRPPLCVPCALTAAGVRPKLRYRRLTWRERRAHRRAVAAALVATRERQEALHEHVTAASLRALYGRPTRALVLDRAGAETAPLAQVIELPRPPARNRGQSAAEEALYAPLRAAAL